MRRFTFWIALVLAIGCESEAPKPSCLSSTCRVVLQGQVQRADGSLATGAVTWWSMYDDTLCVTERANGFTGAVDAAARYQYLLYDAPGVRRCLAVYAAASLAARATDSTGVTSVYTFRIYEPPDTVTLSPIRLP